MPDNRTVVLVEEDYKGEYARFALDPHEFYRCYPFAPEATREGDTYTLRPMVHIWYRSVAIGDPAWKQFFTDMASGLPDSDIANRNLAYIDWNALDDVLLAAVIDTVVSNPELTEYARSEYEATANALESASPSGAECACVIRHLLNYAARLEKMLGEAVEDINVLLDDCDSATTS